MKKKTKTKAKRDPVTGKFLPGNSGPVKAKRRKRNRGGRIAKMIRLLEKWHAWALTDKRKHSEGVALLQYIAAHVNPYREALANYTSILCNVTWEAGIQTPPEEKPIEFASLPKIVAGHMKHLADLRDGRLNYDDMHEALKKLHRLPWYTFRWSSKKRLLTMTGASEALVGAPASDAGKMRFALQETDARLTEIMLQIYNPEAPLTPEHCLKIWKVIHEARAALRGKINVVADHPGYRTAPSVWIEQSPSDK